MSTPLTTLSSFVPLQKLGTGSFSTVYKVKRLPDSLIYALKKVKLTPLKQKQKQNAVNEIRILASLSSPYIIQYKQSFYDSSHNILCIIMQYANGGDLQKIISKAKTQNRSIEEKEIWKAIVHILKGLEVLHSNSILHRDLKSANVFLSGGIYKLGDLNVSKVSKERMVYTQTGTPYYSSPEVWNDKPYDYKSDIWSLGCIVYELCSLRPPFEGRNMEELNKVIQKCEEKRISGRYSRELEKVINWCLRKRPGERPSAKELLGWEGMRGWVKEFGREAEEEKIQQGRRALLGTIRMSGDAKEFQRSLPKSTYESKDKQKRSDQKFFSKQKHNKKQQTSVSISKQPSQQIQPHQQSSQKEKIPYNNFITPQKQKHSPVQLSQIVSQSKPYHKPLIYSDRISTENNKISESSSIIKSKQVLRKLISESQQPLNHHYSNERSGINKTEDTTKPTNLMPRSQTYIRSSSLIKAPLPVNTKKEPQEIKIKIESRQVEKDKIFPVSEQKLSLPLKQVQYLRNQPYRYYTSQKSSRKASREGDRDRLHGIISYSNSKQKHNKYPYKYITDNNNSQQTQISLLLRRLQGNYHENRIKELKNRPEPMSERKPAVVAAPQSKLEVRLQKYSYRDKIRENKKYNVMPSWW